MANNFWEDEEWLKKNAPYLNDQYKLDTQRELYNASADVGSYEPVVIDAPMKQASRPSGWGAFDSVPDMDRYSAQLIAERAPMVAQQPPQQEPKKKSGWEKFKSFLAKASLAIPGVALYGIAKLGLEDRDRAYQMQERQYADQQAILEYKRRQEAELQAQKFWQLMEEMQLKREQSNSKNDQWERQHKLDQQKFYYGQDNDQRKFEADNYWKGQDYGLRNQQLDLQGQELGLRRDLGYQNLRLAEARLARQEDNRASGGGGGAKTSMALTTAEKNAVISQILANVDTYRGPEDFEADVRVNQRGRLIRVLGADGYNKLVKSLDEIDETAYGKRWLPRGDKRRKIKSGFVSYYLNQVEKSL